MSNSASAADEEVVPLWVSRGGAWLGLIVFAACWFAPTPAGLDPAGQRLAAVTALMGIYWVTQALPIEVTSLLPLALFPLLGIQSAKGVGAAYFSDSSFLYLGGFLLALGIERWGLHRRMALHVVVATGTSPRRIVLGFMLATFAISMWISNTAATLLMLPIGLALLDTLPDDLTAARADAAYRRLGMATTLGIGYAATIGGMATLVGTPTNVVYVEVFNRQFPDGPRLSAGQWMATWTPYALFFLIFTWVLLTIGLRPSPVVPNRDRGFVRTQLQALGRLQPGERWMLAIFVITAALWIFRTPFQLADWRLLPGWNQVADGWLSSLGVGEKGRLEWINDSTVAMGMALLMFIAPVHRKTDGTWQRLMDWQTASRLPWGILLLFGGGFAIAEASRTTGLAEWTGAWMAQSAGHWPPWLLIAAVCLLVTFLSEFTSNVATANALLPVIAGLAVAVGVDPRALMLPATLAASCGFMLPIGTPPNAIVFGAGRIRLQQMAGYGLVLDIVGVALLVAATYFLLLPQLGIEFTSISEWAR